MSTLEDFESALSQVLATPELRRLVERPQQRDALRQLVLGGDLLDVFLTWLRKNSDWF